MFTTAHCIHCVGQVWQHADLSRLCVGFAGAQQASVSDQPTSKQVRQLASKYLALPGVPGGHKRRLAAPDTHPIKKSFLPVDPCNAAEASLFMSLYTEHKAPKHLKAFQGITAHWHIMKWVQRGNSAWLGIAYKDGVQLHNFHCKLSAEVGCIESL